MSDLRSPSETFTSRATRSSLMRMKSMRRSAAMPSALWMLFRSSAMSGSEDDSLRRWLRKRETPQSFNVR